MSLMLLWLSGGLALADYQGVHGSLDDEVGTLEGPPLGIGVGPVIGVPLGVSGVWRPGDAFAVQGSLGWHGQEERVSTSVDLVLQLLDLESEDLDAGRFVTYAGPGVVVRWGSVRNVQVSDWLVDRPMMGLRVPAGMVYLPEERRVDVFLELAPTFYMIPQTEVDLTAVLGARVYIGGSKTHL